MDKIKAKIKAQGDRLTSQRLLILEHLRGADHHPTAEEVYDKIKKSLPTISLGTVYRNLKYLVANGFIIQLNMGEGKCRFDGNNKCHYHFICRHCSFVHDIWQVGGAIAEQLGYLGQIDQIECNVYGLCQKCVENKKKKISKKTQAGSTVKSQ